MSINRYSIRFQSEINKKSDFADRSKLRMLFIFLS